MKVLFTSLNAWGHIHPLVPLAVAFRDRGDEVVWATGPSACARLERDGFRTAPFDIDEGVSGQASRAILGSFAHLPPRERPELAFAKLFGEHIAPLNLQFLMPIVADAQPDLIISDTAELAGPIAAAVHGIPHVAHGFGPLLPEARVRRGGEAVAPVWQEHGLTPRPYGGLYDHLYLDIFPPSMHASDRAHIPATQLIQPVGFASSLGEPVPDWVSAAAGDPLVYVTFGTVFNDPTGLIRVVAAVRELPVRVVVTVGPDGDPAMLGPQPANVLVATYIPQGPLLPHCSAVVSHAGSGTFLAAVTAGLPQLCLPQGADQFLNADACVTSGVGLALDPHEVTPEAVQSAVARLLSDRSFAQAADRVGEEIAAMPTPADVAARLAAQFGR